MRWIKDLEIRSQTVKLLEEGINSTLQLIGMGNNFLNMTSKAKEIKAIINKWDSIKLQSLHSSKEIIKNLKRKPAEWE